METQAKEKQVKKRTKLRKISLYRVLAPKEDQTEDWGEELPGRTNSLKH